MYLVGERNTETLVLVSGRRVTFNQVLRGLLECVACLGGEVVVHWRRDVANQ